MLATFYGGVIGGGNTQDFHARNTSEAAYGQLKLNFTRKLSLAFGFRYTADENKQTLDFLNFNPATVTGVPGAVVIPTTKPPLQPEGGVIGNNFSYRVAPQYMLTESSLVYASYSTGYKPGGVAYLSNVYDPFKAETVKATEIGEKSEFFHHRLRLNLSLFREDFNNFQTSILTSYPGPGGTTLQGLYTGNAPGLRSEGADLDLTWRATRNLTVSSNVEYDHAWFTNYVQNPTPGAKYVSYTNTALTNAPLLTANVAVDYTHAIPGNWRIGGHLDYSYRSASWTQLGQQPYSYVAPYALVNGRITVSPPNSPVQFGFYARNIGDKYYSTGWQNIIGLVHYTTLDAYRTLGVFLQAAF